MRTFIKSILITLFFTVLVPLTSLAQENSLEQKAQGLDKRLIAPCCWTSTLDQHFSQESEEMKSELRQLLAQGQSEEQVLDHFEKKFGERILSQPKAAGFNLTVWYFPVLALSFGLILLIRVLRKRKGPVEEITNTLTLATSTPEKDEKYKKMIDDELYRS